MAHRRMSIIEFLTDGSLAALCDALSHMGSFEVVLRDERGRAIRYAEGDHPWRIEERGSHDAEVARASERLVPSTLSAGDGTRCAVTPLVLDGAAVGAITVEGTAEAIDSPTGRTAHRIIVLLAGTVQELLEHDLELKQRHAGLRVLFRLSSMLVAAHDVDSVLSVAIDSMIQILGVDAGLVHLLDESKNELVLRSHRGLSEAFARRFERIHAGADADQRALRGDVLGVSDLLREGHEELLRATHEEGFKGMISSGMVFRGRPLGIVRLFTREEMLLDGDQRPLLQTVVEQVAAAIASAKLLEADRAARQVKRQLKLAGDVQRRMLPRKLPEFDSFDVAAKYSSSYDLGGDIYDLFDLSGHLGIVVGDVAGKGVPAALMMASVRAALRAHATFVYDLDDIMTRVNQDMVRDTLDHEFVTLFYGVLDPGTLRLTYCNAGHDPPLVLRPPAGGGAAGLRDLDELSTGGMVVGIDASQRYQRATFELRPGDILLANTDGLTDAMNFAAKKWGRDRLKRALLDHVTADPNISAGALVNQLFWDMQRFVGLNEQIDDATIVCVRVRAPAGA